MPITTVITKQDRRAKRRRRVNQAATLLLAAIIAGIVIGSLDNLTDRTLAAGLWVTLAGLVALIMTTRKAN